MKLAIEKQIETNAKLSLLKAAIYVCPKPRKGSVTHGAPRPQQHYVNSYEKRKQMITTIAMEAVNLSVQAVCF